MPDSTFQQEQGGRPAYEGVGVVKSRRIDADTSVLLVNMPKDETAYPLGT